MALTDTHTHLFLNEFDEDIDEVISRAMDSGIKRFFIPNIDSSTIDAMMSLISRYPDHCFPMIGLHPCSVKADYEKELKVIGSWLRQGLFRAVGETGIDLYWDQTHIREQEASFRQHIAWAKEYRLPIVIHVRNSFDEALNIVEELNDETLTGIFHCFTGTLDQAERIIGFGGFKLGIGGVLTFKNSGLDRVVRELDPQYLVLETDSPYLAPVPYRGKRNESAYLTYVAAKLAELKNMTVTEIADITTRNSKMVFGV